MKSRSKSGMVSCKGNSAIVLDDSSQAQIGSTEPSPLRIATTMVTMTRPAAQRRSASPINGLVICIPSKSLA